jgi:hypothetical protein
MHYTKKEKEFERYGFKTFCFTIRRKKQMKKEEIKYTNKERHDICACMLTFPAILEERRPLLFFSKNELDIEFLVVQNVFWHPKNQ